MKDRNRKLHNLILYEIYVRNHGPNGSFEDVTNDLERIKSLGVDVIWLMPIHPIGMKNKKGSLGCPYSIQDYRKINPEYGTLDDFKHLISEANRRNLKVMIDVVYNHTSHDSKLVNEHPDFFHQDHQGKPITTVPAWSDVIDLNHPNAELQEYLIETLEGWVEIGVEGFRCDVASIIPLSFWIEAKERVEVINPNVIWLAESVHTAWVIERRNNNLFAQSDTELYRAFDLTYDYDIWPIWQAAVQGKMSFSRYLEMVEFQKGIYPLGFAKMRCVENHDTPRIMALAESEISAKAWTAFEAFNQGAFLIYAGQESGAKHTPSLFDIDKIKWDGYPLQEWLTQLVKINKLPIMTDGALFFLSGEMAIEAMWKNQTQALYGIFNVRNFKTPIKCQLPDGDYVDMITNTTLSVKNQVIEMDNISAAFFHVAQTFEPDKMFFELLQYEIN